MFRPDIGYVQGMSYLAGIVLLYSEDEYRSFMNFSKFIRSTKLVDHLLSAPSSALVVATQRTLENMFRTL